MAPSAAMVLPEVSSTGLDKKFSKLDLNMSDLSSGMTSGMASGMDIHDLAVGSGDIMDHSSSFRATSGSKKSFIRASSPTGSVRSTYTTRRLASRSGSSWHWGTAEYSKELTQSTEAEFKSLMAIMATISTHHATLKSNWSKLTSESEAYFAQWAVERGRNGELEEKMDKRDAEIKRLTYELKEKDKENIKLRDEFSTANATIVELRGQITTRDRDISTLRRDITTAHETSARLRADLEGMQSELIRANLKLTEVTEDLKLSKETAEQYRFELERSRKELVDIQSSYDELTKKYEASRIKVQSLEQLNKSLTVQNHELTHDNLNHVATINNLQNQVDRLEGQLEEMSASKELVIEELETLKQSYAILDRTLKKSERKTAEFTRRIEEIQKKLEFSQNTIEEWKSKCKHYENGYNTMEKQSSQLQAEYEQLKTEHSEISLKIRQITKERQQFVEKYEFESKRSQEFQRKVLILQESLTRTETLHKDKQGEFHSLTERVTLLESELDVSQRKSGELSSAMEKLQTTTATVRAQLAAAISKAESAAERLLESETRYEEMRESMTELEERYSLLESDHETLEKMLADAHEQRETAILARERADAERDEAMKRFEEKCRELAQYEQSLSTSLSQSQSQSHSNGKSEVSRTFSSSKSSSSQKKGTKHVSVTDGASA